LQPPDWVFGVVWPCLYVTTGAAWAVGGDRADLVLGAVTFLCCWWLVAYVCLRQTAVAALALATTVVLTVFGAASLGGTAGALLVPLAVWTAFATYLNTYDVWRGTSE
jgi:tryptophan-rich sensory protein